MARLNATATDQANASMTGAFAGTGASPASIALRGAFNIALWGTFVATVRVEISLDGGTTWVPDAFASGALADLTAPRLYQGALVEPGTLLRLNCISYTSGTVNFRVSQ